MEGLVSLRVPSTGKSTLDQSCWNGTSRDPSKRFHATERLRNKGSRRAEMLKMGIVSASKEWKKLVKDEGQSILVASFSSSMLSPWEFRNLAISGA